MKRFLLAIATFILIFASQAFADPAGVNFPSLIMGIINWFRSILAVILIQVFGFQESWTQFPDLIKYVLVPFLGIFTIVYAFLRELRIFKRTRWSMPVLAFLITFSTLPCPMPFMGDDKLFVYIVNKLFAILGTWSVLMFGFIFFFGVLYYAKLRKAEWGSAVASAQIENEAIDSIRKHLKELYEERSDLVAEMADAKGKKFQDLSEKIQKMNAEINTVSAQLKTLRDM